MMAESLTSSRIRESTGEAERYHIVAVLFPNPPRKMIFGMGFLQSYNISKDPLSVEALSYGARRLLVEWKFPQYICERYRRSDEKMVRPFRMRLHMLNMVQGRLNSKRRHHSLLWSLQLRAHHNHFSQSPRRSPHNPKLFFREAIADTSRTGPPARRRGVIGRGRGAQKTAQESHACVRLQTCEGSIPGVLGQVLRGRRGYDCEH